MHPQEIEKRLGIKLKEELHFENLKTSHTRNAYSCDEDGNITGLNLLVENLDSITIPAGLDTLLYLNVSENKALRSLTFKAELPALEALDVSECSLVELLLPSGFDSLQAIHAQKNKLSGFKIEASCPNLKYLDLAGNQLQEFSLPTGLPNLEILYLQGGNKVKDISFLAGASALQTLNLSGNAVEDLSPVRHLGTTKE